VIKETLVFYPRISSCSGLIFKTHVGDNHPKQTYKQQARKKIRKKAFVNPFSNLANKCKFNPTIQNKNIK
jgi:hypothetical protein